jgi:hypothetical protein
LKKELMTMKQMPERIYITHPKPQYLKAIGCQIERLKINNIRLLHDGDTLTV